MPVLPQFSSLPYSWKSSDWHLVGTWNYLLEERMNQDKEEAQTNFGPIQPKQPSRTVAWA